MSAVSPTLPATPVGSNVVAASAAAAIPAARGVRGKGRQAVIRRSYVCLIT
jgi:hypothetical protein